MPKINKELTQKQYCGLLESCADGCENRYCFFKIFLLEQHPNPRVIAQLKCFELHKYFLSEKAGKDVGWNKAAEDWVERGLAAAFAEIYDGENTPRQNYKDTLEYLKENPPKKT